jgi:hypothetical protein
MQDPELTTLSPSYADDVAVILRPAGTRTSVCRVPEARFTTVTVIRN